MRKRFLELGLLLFTASAILAQQAATPFALHSGDAVVLYGDSITAQRFYTRQVEEFVHTRYPGLKVTFVNAGVPGDTVYGGYAGTMAQRVARDVAPYHPRMITVMLGMNDGGYGYTPPPKMHANFDAGYNALIDALRAAAPTAALTLINPTPYDEITHGTEFPGYSAQVDALSEDLTRIAARRSTEPGAHIDRSDFAGAVHRALIRAMALDPKLAPLLIPDRIHPAEITQWIMAVTLMRTWHADPVVSRISLDAQRLLVLKQERASVRGMQRTEQGLRWSSLEDSLPLPLDLNNVLTQVMLKSSDVAAMDREILEVHGLPAGQYQLRIDQTPAGIWSSEQLDRGINLALVKTPMLDQAGTVDWLEQRRAVLDQARFILDAETRPMEGIHDAEETLKEAGAGHEIAIREKARPKEHSFELSNRAYRRGDRN